MTLGRADCILLIHRALPGLAARAILCRALRTAHRTLFLPGLPAAVPSTRSSLRAATHATIPTDIARGTASARSRRRPAGADTAAAAERESALVSGAVTAPAAAPKFTAAGASRVPKIDAARSRAAWDETAAASASASAHANAPAGPPAVSPSRSPSPAVLSSFAAPPAAQETRTA